LPLSAIGSTAQLSRAMARPPFRALNNKMMTAGKYKSSINKHKTAK
jgi:hypothetical protein